MFLLENIHRLDSSNLTTYACQTLDDLESENENNGTMIQPLTVNLEN
jgi:hypothetical protein